MGEQFIRYETGGAEGRVAVITLDRPEARNAQHPPLLKQLDEAFTRGVEDPAIRVMVLKANGPHFSAGHDISGASSEHFSKIDMSQGQASHYDWEYEHYYGYSRRWRDLPKPTIAAVHGKAIAAGLMLCWPCDLIVASEDAQFSDPVLRMGICGVEYFAHPWELGPRKAKELLFTGGVIDAREALQRGMLNHVVPRQELERFTLELADRIARMDPFALRMAKRAVNRTLDVMGQSNALESVFDMHHLGHAHSRLVHEGDSVSGQTVDTMKKAASG